MAGETIIAVVGNLTADPEIRTTGSGASVASFTIASTPRTWNRNTNQFEDGQALFMRCSAWRDMAEHCAQSLAKGMRVIAQGRLQQRSYQAQDGSQRTVFELQVDEIGPSLRYATAQVAKVQSGTAGAYGNPHAAPPSTDARAQASVYQGGASVPQAPADDPWGQPRDSGSFGSFGAQEPEEPSF
jgi:single-strand DNA-binding protein